MAPPARADILRTVVCHLACSRLTGLPLRGFLGQAAPAALHDLYADRDLLLSPPITVAAR